MPGIVVVYNDYNVFNVLMKTGAFCSRILWRSGIKKIILRTTGP